jgi:aspartyl-tRNA(Asn)/glutamyl-tRNA(Gln) amidotransferase subunit A
MSPAKPRWPARSLRRMPAATAHAAVVQNLLKAGAIVIGKTNMTEFAYSGLGINPHYGTPQNTWSAMSKAAAFPAVLLPARPSR